jgi:hypothetical protein
LAAEYAPTIVYVVPGVRERTNVRLPPPTSVTSVWPPPKKALYDVAVEAEEAPAPPVILALIEHQPPSVGVTHEADTVTSTLPVPEAGGVKVNPVVPPAPLAFAVYG